MAARTLAQLRTAVEDHGYGNDLATQQTTWLNEEYRNLGGMRRWSWLQARFNGTVPALSAFYTPTATDIRSPDRVYMAANATDYPMEWKPAAWLIKRQQGDLATGATGTPRYWTWAFGGILFYPVLDVDYAIRFDYTKNVVPLVADSDVPLVPEAYDDILVWGAVARSAVRQNNWLTRDFAIQQKETLLNRMDAEEGLKQTQSSQEVEWTGFWDADIGDPRWR